MTKEARMTKSDVTAPHHLIIRHSFELRHSDFVILFHLFRISCFDIRNSSQPIHPQNIDGLEARLPSQAGNLTSNRNHTCRRFHGNCLGLVGDQLAQERNQHDERNADCESDEAEV
jgi:hypothetical protein